MMKKIYCLLLLPILIIMLTACATGQLPQGDKTPTPPSNKSPVEDTDLTPKTPNNTENLLEADFMPLIFSSEEELFNAIDEAESRDDVNTPDGNNGAEAHVREQDDVYGLTKITEFYRPKHVFQDLQFEKILVKEEYVSYYYADDDGRVTATFTWFTKMSPEVGMNGWEERGYTEAIRNGIRYMYERWEDEAIDGLGGNGCEVRWVQDGKSFAASVIGDYTDDEIFAFCEIQTVIVN